VYALDWSPNGEKVAPLTLTPTLTPTLTLTLTPKGGVRQQRSNHQSVATLKKNAALTPNPKALYYVYIIYLYHKTAIDLRRFIFICTINSIQFFVFTISHYNVL
jgi:hypothetical protein